MDRAVRQIPATVTRVDPATGKQTHARTSWSLLPPRAGTCQFCAVEHEVDEPHDALSRHYRIAFSAVVGRAPTWVDAMAHWSGTTRATWKAEPIRRGTWSEPLPNEAPVCHHGID
jgi:hypothetical protein